MINMDYNLILNMKVEELKNYLRLQGLKMSGRKIELIAKVFAAGENDVPILKTALEEKKEYENKLTIEKVKLPDPFKLEID